MAWIAIDVGTSVIKTVAFGDDGSELAIARQKTAVLHPRPEFSEQDMDGVWTAVVETVKNVVARLTEPVRGVVSTAQGDGAWLVNADGEPTGNAILWNDGRAAPIVEHWHERGIIEKAFRYSGSVTYPGMSNAIFAWLANHDPERLRQSRWCLSCNGWIHAKLTGRFVADPSDASNPFSDVMRCTYAAEVLKCFEVEQYASLLPPILSEEQLTAPITAEAAGELELPLRTRAIMAPYDIVSTAYGAGASKAGQACVILGTTICAEAITDSLDLSAKMSGTTIALGHSLHLRAMPTLSGCEALDWTASLLKLDGAAELSALAAQAAFRRDDVFFLPYLSTAGERAPFLNPAARGSFHGLSFATTPAQIARSVFEGLSFVVRECLETAVSGGVHELFVCGGGARSDLWCQMVADVTGVRVIRSSDSEVGARGAHLFALKAMGEIASFSEGGRRFVTNAMVFHSAAERHRSYSSRFSRFLNLRQTATEQWKLMVAE